MYGGTATSRRSITISAFVEGPLSQPAVKPNLPDGLRVLIAEDNFLIGDCMRLILLDLNCIVIGPVEDVDDVLRTIQTDDIDGALLDIQLGDENIYPAASELAARGIPFILATGRRDLTDLPALLANAPLLTKPFDAPHLEKMIGATFRPRVGDAQRRPGR